MDIRALDFIFRESPIVAELLTKDDWDCIENCTLDFLVMVKSVQEGIALGNRSTAYVRTHAAHLDLGGVVQGTAEDSAIYKSAGHAKSPMAVKAKVRIKRGDGYRIVCLETVWT